MNFEGDVSASIAARGLERFPLQEMVYFFHTRHHISRGNTCAREPGVNAFHGSYLYAVVFASKYILWSVVSVSSFFTELRRKLTERLMHGREKRVESHSASRGHNSRTHRGGEDGAGKKFLSTRDCFYFYFLILEWFVHCFRDLE